MPPRLSFVRSVSLYFALMGAAVWLALGAFDRHVSAPSIALGTVLLVGTVLFGLERLALSSDEMARSAG